MKLRVPLPAGLSLTIADQVTGDPTYPTARLQKGLLLSAEGQDLAEEGVGFGVPVLKRGFQTIFPGGVELDWRAEGPVWQVTAAFHMDLVERLAGPGGEGPRSRLLYAAKDSLAALHRRAPVLRGPLTTASAALRRACGWVTTFERADFHAEVNVTYAIDTQKGALDVAVDMADLPGRGVSEVVLMNEQGGRWFDTYLDSDGVSLRGSDVGTWDEVTAARASFASTAQRVAYTLRQVEGARLLRGRELVGSRLAWSGFGYSLAPTAKEFAYPLRIERTP